MNLPLWTITGKPEISTRSGVGRFPAGQMAGRLPDYRQTTRSPVDERFALIAVPVSRP
jgi:hypothetical protein